MFSGPTDFRIVTFGGYSAIPLVADLTAALTETKQQLQQTKQVQLQEIPVQYARELAHELNNIFTRILAATQLLSNSQPAELDSSTQRKLQLLLEESARQGASLVKHMLNSRQERDDCVGWSAECR